MYDIFHRATKGLFISSSFQEKGKSCTRREGTKGLGRTEGAMKKGEKGRIIKLICLSPQQKKSRRLVCLFMSFIKSIQILSFFV